MQNLKPMGLNKCVYLMSCVYMLTDFPSAVKSQDEVEDDSPSGSATEDRSVAR